MITCDRCFMQRHESEQFCNSLTCIRRAQFASRQLAINPTPEWVNEPFKKQDNIHPLFTGNTTGGGNRVIRGTRNLS